MKVAGLFAGIGGLERGFEEAGHAANLLCETWKPARAVLQARFPDVPLADDVRALASLPEATDIVTAGFPCQDLSQAGMTAGISGQRSGLVGEVFRLLDRRRVPLVLLENVSFMLHLDGGRGMRALVDAFEERGYRWCYRVVNTLSFLPQRRERVYFLASSGDIDPADILLVDEATPSLPVADLGRYAHGFYWTEGTRGLGWAVDAIPTLKNGSTVGIASPPAILRTDGRGIKPDIRDAERLQGFPADWTAPAEAVGRASMRWSLVGNAVSVPAASWIGRRLDRPGSFDPARARPPGDSPPWPAAALGGRDGRHRAVDISRFPAWFERPALETFLRHPGALLSARATRGFLSRARAGRLRFVDGFLDRLQAHLETMEACDGPGRTAIDRAAAIAAE